MLGRLALRHASLDAGAQRSSVYIVRRIALARGARLTISRTASMPFNAGIARSITTTWGCRRSAMTIASRPSDASPTTSNFSRSSSARNP
jgi:hypothetical protein